MSMHGLTSSPAFFEAKYKAKADPWDFASAPYELHRYEAVLAALGDRHFCHAYEPGCSVGVLTERLAQVCDLVEAIDFSPTASQQAEKRCAGLSNVHVRCAALPEQTSPAGYDLLVLSEIGYYFEFETWARVSADLVSAMPRCGTVLAAHWLGTSEDHILSGDEVHEVLLANPQLRVEHAERTEFFRLERMVRV